MDINQSSVEGNKDILEAIMEGTLQLPPQWFEGGRRVILAGDQLTVSRIRSLKELQWDDITAYHRLEWAVPVIQLFHLQMITGSTILCNHYGHLSTPGSLAYNAIMLGQKCVNLDKPDFHATDELLCHTFHAIALMAWQQVLGLEDLSGLAKRIGKAHLSELTKTSLDSFMNQYLNAKNIEALNNTSSKNAALFLRDMLLYIELSSAIKASDVGHLEEVIKWLTIMFQSGSTRNYANELLHLHCGLSYSWSAQTKEAVILSWLVNTTGQPN